MPQVRLNAAVDRPMPSASAATAARVWPGVLASRRNPKRMSRASPSMGDERYQKKGHQGPQGHQGQSPSLVSLVSLVSFRFLVVPDRHQRIGAAGALGRNPAG